MSGWNYRVVMDVADYGDDEVPIAEICECYYREKDDEFPYACTNPVAVSGDLEELLDILECMSEAVGKPAIFYNKDTFKFEEYNE